MFLAIRGFSFKSTHKIYLYFTLMNVSVFLDIRKNLLFQHLVIK